MLFGIVFQNKWEHMSPEKEYRTEIGFVLAFGLPRSAVSILFLRHKKAPFPLKRRNISVRFFDAVGCAVTFKNAGKHGLQKKGED